MHVEHRQIGERQSEMRRRGPLLLGVVVLALMGCGEESPKRRAADLDAGFLPPESDAETGSDAGLDPSDDACVAPCDPVATGFERISADVPATDSSPSLNLIGFAPGQDTLIMSGPADARELYEALGFQLGSSTLVQLSAGLPARGVANVLDADRVRGVRTRDGAVLVAMDKETRGRPDLFAVSLTDGSARKLSRGLEPVAGAWFASDSDQILYVSGGALPTKRELFATRFGTPAPVQLTASDDDQEISIGQYGIHPQITADGARALYAARAGNSAQWELRSVKTDGSDVQLLSPAPVPGGGVFIGESTKRCGYQLAGDGTRAVFVADAEVDQRFELYAAKLDGSGRHKLSPGGSTSVLLDACPLTADGTRIVYGLTNGAATELHVADIASGEDTRLDTANMSAAFAPVLSGDARGVVFVGSDKALYFVSLEGGAPVLLASGVVGATTSMAATSERAIFLRSMGAPAKNVLSSVRFDGTELVELAGDEDKNLLSFPGAGGRSWPVTANGEWVVYQLGQGGAAPHTEVRASRTDGSETRILTPEDARDVAAVDALLDADSGSVAIVTPGATSHARRFFFADLAAGTTREASPVPAYVDLDLNGSFCAENQQACVFDETHIQPLDVRGLNVLRWLDAEQRFVGSHVEVEGASQLYTTTGTGALGGLGEWVAFTAVREKRFKLVSARLSDGKVYDLGPKDSPASLDRPIISPDERWVAFKLTEPGGKNELWVSAIDGTSPRRVSGDDLAIAAPNSGAYRFTPDGKNLVFLARSTGSDASCNPYRLYLTDLMGTKRTELSGPLVECGNVSALDSGTVYGLEVHFTPDGKRVLYVADAEVDEQFDLYSVALDGTSRRRLTGALSSEHVQLKYSGPVLSFTPDGKSVVFEGASVVDSFLRKLLIVAVDGSAAPKLVGDGAQAGFGASVSFSRDGKHLAYLATDASGEHYLWRVGRLDGSGDKAVSDPFTERQSRVPVILGSMGDEFFATDAEGVLALRFDGTSSRRVLSLKPETKLWDLKLVANQRAVLFVADYETPGVDELFAVTIDGKSARKLTPPLDAGRSVQSFWVGPGEHALAVLMDGRIRGVFELFSVSWIGVPVTIF